MTDPIEDAELTAIETALAALITLPNRQAWLRALDYIINRLTEDERTGHLAALGVGIQQPTQYVLGGDLDARFASASEALGEADTPVLTIVEVNGIAIVSQRFGIEVPIDCDAGGTDFLWFDTREQANAYLADMPPLRADEADD